MKISHEVRAYAKEQGEGIEVQMLEDPLEGMKQKSAEFLAKGSELYHQKA